MSNDTTGLVITNLHVDVETESGPKPILKGVDLTIRPGEIHAIMGPNGSGKSTLAYAIAGHPKYTITDGTVVLDGVDLTEMTPDERARAGMFLAM
ncbi:MAG TPA: ATP-binding cassette domain-containing protein, partial [Propionibacteriaceae bacterium]|nr:ATP-binding cassette domain-containing protein [Propionibacteriaceae bacterium]